MSFIAPTSMVTVEPYPTVRVLSILLGCASLRVDSRHFRFSTSYLGD
jgi:hypothetical protein